MLQTSNNSTSIEKLDSFHSTPLLLKSQKQNILTNAISFMPVFNSLLSIFREPIFSFIFYKDENMYLNNMTLYSGGIEILIDLKFYL